MDRELQLIYYRTAEHKIRGQCIVFLLFFKLPLDIIISQLHYRRIYAIDKVFIKLTNKTVNIPVINIQLNLSETLSMSSLVAEK